MAHAIEELKADASGTGKVTLFAVDNCRNYYRDMAKEWYKEIWENEVNP